MFGNSLLSIKLLFRLSALVTVSVEVRCCLVMGMGSGMIYTAGVSEGDMADIYLS